MTTTQTATPPSTTGAPPKGPRIGGGRQSGLLLIAERFGLLFVFILMVVGFSILRPETFPTLANWQAILVSQSVVAVAALALVIPLSGGRFDISVGANLGLCAIACAAVMSKSNAPLLLAILVAVGFGTAVGVANGFIVAYLGVNSIIGTLGTATIIGGFVQLYTEGIPISGGLSTTLTSLSTKEILGIPQLFAVALLASVAAWYLLTQTAYGRRLAAVGVNATAAHLVGIAVRRTVMLSFVASGLLAGVAGVMAVGLQGSGSPEIGGIDAMLPALAAAFLGATVFYPGQYNIPGTLLGLLFVGTAVSGLALLGVDPWVEQVFNGSAVVIAVALSQYFRRQRTGETDIGG